MFLAYQPYKGPASIPHVGGEFFGAFFLAMNVRCFNLHLLAYRAPTRNADPPVYAADHPSSSYVSGQRLWQRAEGSEMGVSICMFDQA